MADTDKWDGQERRNGDHWRSHHWRAHVDHRLDVQDEMLKTIRSELLDEKAMVLIDTLLERERTRSVLRKAVIEKSMIGLVWGIFGILGTLIWSGSKEWLKGVMK